MNIWLHFSCQLKEEMKCAHKPKHSDCFPQRSTKATDNKSSYNNGSSLRNKQTSKLKKTVQPSLMKKPAEVMLWVKCIIGNFCKQTSTLRSYIWTDGVGLNSVVACSTITDTSIHAMGWIIALCCSAQKHYKRNSMACYKVNKLCLYMTIMLPSLRQGSASPVCWLELIYAPEPF